MKLGAADMLTSADYAWWWLSLSAAVIILTVVAALYVCQDTIAEQGLKSRRFLPSENHYKASELLGKARLAASGTGDAVSGWIDGLGDDEAGGT
jgi:hypothetical protein